MNCVHMNKMPDIIELFFQLINNCERWTANDLKDRGVDYFKVL